MYKSPIEIIQDDLQMQLEDNIMKAVRKHHILVDPIELTRALQYDRGQYEKGYFDGKADVMTSIIRCYACEYYDEDGEYCKHWHGVRHPEHFCGDGEGRTNE